MDTENLIPNSAIIDQILSVAKNRTEILDQLRKAILDNNQKDIEELSKKLCGLKKQK